jgi:hypothetical protein
MDGFIIFDQKGIANLNSGTPFPVIPFTNDTLMDEKAITNSVTGTSREKMDERKKAPKREAGAKSSKTKINISSEYHQEKAGLGRKDNAVQRKIHKIYCGFSSIK